MLRNKIKDLDLRYETLMNEINAFKANGNLSTLYNLKNQFDETFDSFFDNENLRKKYNDWNYEENCILLEKSNGDLLKELDDSDLEYYIKFYENYIDKLEDQLIDLKDSRN